MVYKNFKLLALHAVLIFNHQKVSFVTKKRGFAFFDEILGILKNLIVPSLAAPYQYSPIL